MKILVKLEKCWADEFDCEMFSVYEAESVEALRLQLARAATELEGVEVSFGTNEFLNADAADFIGSSYNRVEYIPLSEEEASFIEKTFGKCYGTGKSYFDYLSGKA